VGEPARFIAACDPEWVALEQVPSVLPLWKVYASELRKRGYSVWCGKINSADYGVPQTRVRAILIASRVRSVSRPLPTHYDASRLPPQLFCEPWVSMAAALGWGATDRSAPTVTAGGTATGGAEPFGHRDRDALQAERDAGRWALRAGNQPHAALRPAPAPAPAPAIAFGHNSARMQWVLRMDTQSKATLPRPAHEPAPTIQFAHRANLARWELHTNRGQAEDGTRQTVDPSSASALTAKSGGQWVVKGFRNNNNNNACERTPDEPAGTLFFGGRSNWAAWVTDQESVRITVQEAAVLQSFRADYPWQGTETKQFQQVGNAWCPRAAAAVLGEAAGIDWQPLVARYYGELEREAS
jgi:DNA (cytosine-5)-methyltransferase 1